MPKKTVAAEQTYNFAPSSVHGLPPAGLDGPKMTASFPRIIADPSLERGHVAERLLALNARRKVAALFGQSKQVIELTGRIRRLVHINGGVPAGVKIDGVLVEGGLTAYPARHPSTTVTHDAKMFGQDDRHVVSEPTVKSVPGTSGAHVASEQETARKHKHDAKLARTIRSDGKKHDPSVARTTYDLTWSQRVTMNSLAQVLSLLRPSGYKLTRQRPDDTTLEYVLRTKAGDEWRFVCVPDGSWCFDVWHNDKHIDEAFVMQPDKRGTDQQGVPLSMLDKNFVGVVSPLEAQRYTQGWSVALDAVRTWGDALRPTKMPKA